MTTSSPAPIRNKVAESGILTLDLAQYLPAPDAIALFDLQPMLFMGMILKEKDYRAALQDYDWSLFVGKHAGIHCTADAIIPMWAYMLAASYLRNEAASVHFGNEDAVRRDVLLQNIQALQPEDYADKRIVLKGCGDVTVPPEAYIAATAHLQPVAKSIMYGEPCSTVPVYKAKKNA